MLDFVEEEIGGRLSCRADANTLPRQHGLFGDQLGHTLFVVANNRLDQAHQLIFDSSALCEIRHCERLSPSGKTALAIGYINTNQRFLIRGREQLLLRCSRLKLIVADGGQEPNTFVAEAAPAVASCAQHRSMLTPDHQKGGQLEAAPKHEFQSSKRSSAALQAL